MPGSRVGGHEERGPVDRRLGGARRGICTGPTVTFVCGPTASDCDIRTGAIGADGYAFYLTPDGVGSCVRPHRYALAIAGGSVAAAVLGLHECDNPVCVKVADATEAHRYVVSGSRGDNTKRIARMVAVVVAMRCDASTERFAS